MRLATWRQAFRERTASFHVRPLTEWQSDRAPRVPRVTLLGRGLLLFLVAVLSPCLVLVALGLRILDQERQLDLKRRTEERQRQLAGLSQELLARLERIKISLAFSPVPATDALVAAVGQVRSGRVVFPWDENPGILSFCRRLLSAWSHS